LPRRRQKVRRWGGRRQLTMLPLPFGAKRIQQASSWRLNISVSRPLVWNALAGL